MIVDRHPVLIVERVIVRCDECPRQVSVYVGTGVNATLEEQLVAVGWYLHRALADAHFCPEHSS